MSVIYDMIKAPAGQEDMEGNGTTEFCKKDDPKWPLKCECGYEFQDADMRQWNSIRLYQNPETRQCFVLSQAPPGAMWYADWMGGWKGPDGHCLIIQTPGGQWCLDNPRQRWVRTGTPPNVTAKPSILFYTLDGSPGYHAWLTDGVLTEC